MLESSPEVDIGIDPAMQPDGVTLLAPYEQYQPSDFPGATTKGDAPAAMALFDLSADPNEQHNVAGANPDVVKRLKSRFDVRSPKTCRWKARSRPKNVRKQSDSPAKAARTARFDKQLRRLANSP